MPKKVEKFDDSKRTDKEIIYDGATKTFLEQFVLIGKANKACLLKESRWALTRRTCTTSSTKPPPPPVLSCTHQCRWLIVKYPEDSCPAGEAGEVQASDTEIQSLELSHAWAKKDKADQAKCGDYNDAECAATKRGGCEHCTNFEAAPADKNCPVSFKCGRFGTYTLKMVVNDGCQEASEYTTVTCRCESRRIIENIAPLPSIFGCIDKGKDGNKKMVYEWKDETLGPVFTKRTLSPRLPSCATPPRSVPAPIPSAVPADRCCPTRPPCHSELGCPKCPTCPPCSTAGSVPLASESRTQFAQRRLLSMHQEAVQPAVTATSANALVSPISAVLIISMFANIALYNRIQRRRSDKEDQKEAMEATML